VRTSTPKAAGSRDQTASDDSNHLGANPAQLESGLVPRGQERLPFEHIFQPEEHLPESPVLTSLDHATAPLLLALAPVALRAPSAKASTE